MPMFLQIDDCCSDHAADDAFEALHKALVEDPGGNDAALWEAHPNPWIAPVVNQSSNALANAVHAIREGFDLATDGHPLPRLAKAFGWGAMDDATLADAVRYLGGMLPTTYALEDWLLVVDVLMAQNMPPGFIATQAEAMAVRADLLGRVQAVVLPHQVLSIPALVALVPASLAALPAGLLNPVETAILGAAAARAAVNITDIADRTRSMMKRAVVDHTTGLIRGDTRGGTRALQQRLFERFADLNRDVRRLAITEVGEACNQGFIAASPPGSYVRRMEHYTGACAFCVSLHDKVFQVVAPDHEPKDGATMIWEGKTNIGRSASPRKKLGGALIARDPHEMYWAAAGVFHPNCRGRWVPTAPPLAATANVSPTFVSWLDKMIAEAHAPG